jgi:hypothetical protein
MPLNWFLTTVLEVAAAVLIIAAVLMHKFSSAFFPKELYTGWRLFYAGIAGAGVVTGIWGVVGGIFLVSLLLAADAVVVVAGMVIAYRQAAGGSA